MIRRYNTGKLTLRKRERGRGGERERERERMEIKLRDRRTVENYAAVWTFLDGSKI